MEDAWTKWIRDPYRIAGAIIALIGLGGIPDDLQNWGRALGAIARMLDHDIARWLFCITGIGLFVAASRLPHFRPMKTSVAKPSQAARQPSLSSMQSSPPESSIEPLLYAPKSLADLMLVRQMVRAGKLSSSDPDDMIPPMTCPLCEGNGRKWGRYEAICSKCGGTGELPGEFSEFPKCIVCGGNGRKFGRYERLCDTCNGLGVRIPRA
jgi:hypothetical protein